MTSKKQKRRSLQTYLQHIGLAPFNHQGVAAVPLPAERSSTVRFQTLTHLDQALQSRAHGEKEPPVYGRAGLSTHRALEEVCCTLEGGGGAVLWPSGMVASGLALVRLVQRDE